MVLRRRTRADATETAAVRIMAALILALWASQMIMNGFGKSTGNITLYFIYVVYTNSIASSLVKCIIGVGVTLIARKFVGKDFPMKYNIAALIASFLLFVLLSLLAPYEGVMLADRSEPAGLTYYAAMLRDIHAQEECTVSLPADEVYVGTITKRVHWRTRQEMTTYYVHYRSADGTHYTARESKQFAGLVSRICSEKIPVILTYYPNSGFIASVNGVSKGN